MKSKRREARELAMKILFQVEVGHQPLEEVLEVTAEAVPLPAEEWEYVRDVVGGVLRDQSALDRIIAERAVGWKLERIANVDRNVLRLALYELTHRPDIPASVSVNEAVEMAKKYSTTESGKFVNGILGAYLRECHSPEAAIDVSDDVPVISEASGT
jgi:N utilization substance protein B